MKKVAIPSYITGVPSEPIFFGDDSIIIEDQGVEFLIGKAASERDPEGARRFHGTFKRPQYRRLVMGLIASLLGEGEFEADLAMCAPRPSMGGFRKKPSSHELSDEQWELLVSSVSEIRFRKGSSEAPLKICKLRPTTAKVLYELESVKKSIPSRLKSHVLWQLGHGDFQQITFIDNKPKVDTHAHVEGISGAIKIFAKLTGHAAADAEEGWRSGRLSRPGGMNGEVFSDEEYTELKLKALREYFGTTVPKLLNLNEKYRQRANNVILSGGGVHESLALQVLREEVEVEGLYRLFPINDLPISDERCNDPSFTTVEGLLSTGASVVFDAGNSFLKGGAVV